MSRNEICDAVVATVARHEILRTAFRLPPGMTAPVQVIKDAQTRWLPTDSVALKASADEIVSAMQAACFELETGPGLHAFVSRRDDGYLLGIGAPALCADSKTLRALASEVVGALAGQRLPGVETQYADIGEWQNELFESDAMKAGREFWTRQGMAEKLSVRLPFLKLESPGFSSFEVHSLRRELDPGIVAMAQRLGTDEQTVLLSCWLALLTRLAGGSEVATGIWLDGRTFEGLASCLGPLSSFIPLAAPSDLKLPFGGFVEEVRRRLAEVTERQHYFDRAAFESSARNCFPTCFEFNDQSWSYQVDQVRIELLGEKSLQDRLTSKVLLIRRPTGLSAEFQWLRGECEADAIERLADEFQTLAASVVRNIDFPVDAHPLVGMSERRTLLRDFNAAPIGQPDLRRADELIEAWATHTPDALAAVYVDRYVTFAELKDRSDHLAHYLASRGAGLETRIGIALERSIEIVVAILGVLKCGATYVPLDPAAPSSRIERIVSDAEISILLTRTGLRDRVPATIGAVICLDSDSAAIAERALEARLPQTSPDNLAYILYTSGSTGEPKGVMIPHRGLTNYLLWACSAYRVSAGVGAPLHSSLGFDLTITSLLCPLAAGRAVYLLPEDGAVDHLARILETGAEFSLVKITPAHLRLLNHKLNPQCALAKPGALVVGGEELRHESLEYWRAKAPQTRIINEYGPTETVVGCCVYEVERSDPRTGPVAIGKPIANTRLYLLDCYSNLAPVGAPGELYIGGAGVARGYSNDPLLTAERFVPDPFGEEQAARLYRTGDLARYLPNGNLEFIGRVDQQVKIRGFRVELGEIEIALSRHPAIQSSRVIAAERIPGSKQLIAYFIPRDGAVPRAVELRQFLAERLADYMIPSAFVVLDEFPLTANGKLDVTRLPEPQSSWMNARHRYEPPRTQAEQTLAAIWAQCLRVDKIGIHDNFFELGGDSITSIQVVARANQEGIRLRAKDIFQRQTIAELSAMLETPEAQSAALVAKGDSAPLLPTQLRFFETPSSDRRAWAQAAILEARGRLDAALFEQAVQTVVALHDAFGLTFRKESGRMAQVSSSGRKEIPFQVVDSSGLTDEELEGRIAEMAAEMLASFNLTDGPLSGVALFQGASDGHDRVLMIVHHLIIDGVSWRILLNDLQDAFYRLQNGEAYDRPCAGPQFLACAQELHRIAQSPELADELEYWVSDSRSLASALTDPVLGDLLTESRFHELDEEMTSALIEGSCRELRASPNELLLSALARSLALRFGVRSLLIDVESHGRAGLVEKIGGSQTVGLFTAIFPLLAVVGDGAPVDTLRAIQNALREVPQEGLGYGLLRYSASSRVPAAALKSMRQPEVLFNYLGSFDNVLRDNSPFISAREYPLPERNQHSQYRFEIGARVSQRRLQFNWTFRLHPDQIGLGESLVDLYLEELRGLIRCSRSQEAVACLDLSDLRSAAGIEDLYPLSPMQNGMLFRSLSDPSSGEYFEQSSCRLSGMLDPEALIMAWQMMVDRHPALRTSFVSEPDGRYMQAVHSKAKLPVRYEDWRAFSPDEQQKRLQEFLDSDRRAGFRLDQAPLIRLALFQIADGEHRFTLSSHHAILDGWSLHLVLGETLEVYRALKERRAIALPPPAPFRHYINWLARQDAASAEKFWRSALRGFSAATPINLAIKPGVLREAPPSKHFPDEATTLSASLTSALLDVAHQYQLTLGAILQGAWALLLGLYSGEEEVLFGIVSSGRSIPIPDAESIVGMMMNTNPVRVRINPSDRLPSWLNSLQQARAEAIAYEHTPLSVIRSCSEVPSDKPLFETLLVIENYSTKVASNASASSIVISDLQLEDRTEFPLMLVTKLGERLSLRLSYDGTRFDPETAKGALRHYTTLLETIACHPGKRLSEVSALEDRERQQLLISRNSNVQPRPHSQCLHQWFEEQVKKTPDAVAIVFGDQAVTYEQLNLLSNTIARRLLEFGRGPEVPIALFLEPSIEMISGVIGVLKAGSFYVPIDTSSPRDRIESLLQDTGSLVVLTHSKLVGNLPAGRQFLLLDEFGAEGGRSEAPASFVTPENLAYLIYTSGSTGQPKGVQISHHAASQLFLSTADWFEFGRGDVWTLFHSYAFDFSVWEMWGALLFGGRLVVVPRWMARSPEDFYGLLCRERVTVLNQTPSAFRQLISTDHFLNSSDAHALRFIIFGGEALNFGSLRPWFERNPESPKVINMFGITETTVHVTYREVTRADTEDGDGSLIGSAIPNLQFYILRRDLQPAPFEVRGEIYVGGDQLARGYWRRPELTAQRFVPNPFATAPGQRLYRSGDLAAWRADRDVAYFGRIDKQVKIRGFRIETGEVEAALRKCPEIRDAVVVAREDKPGEPRLVAYVVLSDELRSSDIRRRLLEQLPDYMAPAAIVKLQKLPLTGNGKLDLRNLPALETASEELAPSYHAPRTSIEETLAAIWADVLGLEGVGIYDNFFELGGDSILSLQISARARQHGIRISPAAVFEFPTIAALAETCEMGSASAPGQEPGSGSVPFTPVQRWFLEQEFPRPEFWNQAVLLDADPEPELPDLDRAVQALLYHHDALRHRFKQTGQAGWEQESIAYEDAHFITEVDLSSVPQEDRDAELQSTAAQAQASLDLENGALQRFVLFTTKPAAGARLLIVVHHLVIDTVSWRILLEDLKTAYGQASRGIPVQLPKKSNSYKAWAARLIEEAQSLGESEEAQYWIRQARSEHPRTPVDLLGGANTEASARVETIGFEEEETRLLLTRVPEISGAYTQETLIAAFGLAWRRWTGQNKLLLNMEGHGRENLFSDIDLSRTVGWFTTLSPISLEIPDTDDIWRLLESVGWQLREVPHHGIGYGMLRYLNSGPVGMELKRSPHPEIAFNYLGQIDPSSDQTTPFRLTRDLRAPVRDPNALRPHLIELSAGVFNGRLYVSWHYSANCHLPSTIRSLAMEFKETMQSLLIECRMRRSS